MGLKWQNQSFDVFTIENEINKPKVIQLQDY